VGSSESKHLPEVELRGTYVQNSPTLRALPSLKIDSTFCFLSVIHSGYMGVLFSEVPCRILCSLSIPPNTLKSPWRFFMPRKNYNKVKC
jgi:hypothetical protein